MANNLKNLRIEEGSFVDKGANQEAKVVFFKRDLLLDSKGGEDMKKAGKAISSSNASKMTAMMDKMKSMMDTMKSMLGMKDNMSEDMQKGGRMTLDEKVREELSDEVKKYLEDLEDKAKDAEEQVKKVEELEKKVEEFSKENGDKDEDKVLKSLPEPVRKRIEEAEDKAAKAEEVAKSEKELRITKQYEDEAKDLPAMGETSEIAKMLRSADEVSEESGKKFRETMKAAQAKIDANDKLTKEIGKAGGDDGSDADAKLDAMAEEVAKKDGITKEQAYDKVTDTKEGQELYRQSKKEVK